MSFDSRSSELLEHKLKQHEGQLKQHQDKLSTQDKARSVPHHATITKTVPSLFASPLKTTVVRYLDGSARLVGVSHGGRVHIQLGVGYNALISRTQGNVHEEVVASPLSGGIGFKLTHVKVQNRQSLERVATTRFANGTVRTDSFKAFPGRLERSITWKYINGVVAYATYTPGERLLKFSYVDPASKQRLQTQVRTVGKVVRNQLQSVTGNLNGSTRGYVLPGGILVPSSTTATPWSKVAVSASTPVTVSRVQTVLNGANASATASKGTMTQSSTALAPKTGGGYAVTTTTNTTSTVGEIGGAVDTAPTTATMTSVSTDAGTAGATGWSGYSSSSFSMNNPDGSTTTGVIERSSGQDDQTGATVDQVRSTTTTTDVNGNDTTTIETTVISTASDGSSVEVRTSTDATGSMSVTTVYTDTDGTKTESNTTIDPQGNTTPAGDNGGGTTGGGGGTTGDDATPTDPTDDGNTHGGGEGEKGYPADDGSGGSPISDSSDGCFPSSPGTDTEPGTVSRGDGDEGVNVWIGGANVFMGGQSGASSQFGLPTNPGDPSPVDSVIAGIQSEDGYGGGAKGGGFTTTPPGGVNIVAMMPTQTDPELLPNALVAAFGRLLAIPATSAGMQAAAQAASRLS